MSIISQHPSIIRTEPRFPLGAVLSVFIIIASLAGFVACAATGVGLIEW